MLVTPEGMLMPVSALHPEKVEPLISITPDGILTLVSAVHPLKAL